MGCGCSLRIRVLGSSKGWARSILRPSGSDVYFYRNVWTTMPTSRVKQVAAR